jgi:hypothetical protein
MSGLVRFQGPDKDTRQTKPCDKGPHAISSESLHQPLRSLVVAPVDC